MQHFIRGIFRNFGRDTLTYFSGEGLCTITASCGIRVVTVMGCVMHMTFLCPWPCADRKALSKPASSYFAYCLALSMRRDINHAAIDFISILFTVAPSLASQLLNLYIWRTIVATLTGAWIELMKIGKFRSKLLFFICFEQLRLSFVPIVSPSRRFWHFHWAISARTTRNYCLILVPSLSRDADAAGSLLSSKLLFGFHYTVICTCKSAFCFHLETRRWQKETELL